MSVFPACSDAAAWTRRCFLVPSPQAAAALFQEADRSDPRFHGEELELLRRVEGLHKGACVSFLCFSLISPPARPYRGRRGLPVAPNFQAVAR